ncbi:MAG: hypothetical protein H0U49_06860 [Parachlamydiaceae bacterium]|nr:hypothetical protein [Parachlamydiaceae bacterium]
MTEYAKKKFEFQKLDDPWLLFEFKGHSCNARFIDLKDYIFVAGKELNKNIIEPANRIKNLDPSKIERILDRTLVKKNVTKIYEKFSKKRSIIHFSNELKNSIAKKFHSELDNNIERVMNEITLSAVREGLSTLMSKLIKDGDLKDCCSKILKTLEHKLNDEYISPLAFASIVQNALLESLPSIFSPIDAIENHIRSHFFLPEVIKVANLNWTGNMKKFQYLFLEYSFVKNEVVLNTRTGDIDCPFSTSHMEALLAKTRLIFLK